MLNCLLLMIYLSRCCTMFGRTVSLFWKENYFWIDRNHQYCWEVDEISWGGSWVLIWPTVCKMMFFFLIKSSFKLLFWLEECFYIGNIFQDHICLMLGVISYFWTEIISGGWIKKGWLINLMGDFYYICTRLIKGLLQQTLLCCILHWLASYGKSNFLIIKYPNVWYHFPVF